MDFKSQFSILALVAEDLEGLVEDRSKFGEDRATANATTYVMFDLRLWDTHTIHFPTDVVPA